MSSKLRNLRRLWYTHPAVYFRLESMRLRHLKEEANHLISKGKLDKAAEVLAQAIALEPADPLLRLRHAECCRKLGRIPSAVASYIDSADLLRKQGHYSRAMAAIKLALELSPGHPALTERLVHLENEKQQATLLPTGSSPGVRTVTRQLELDAILAHSRRTFPLLPMETSSRRAPDAERNDGPVVMGVLESTPPNRADTLYPMFRRLSERVLAIRPTAQSRWIMVTSDSAVNVSIVDELPVQPATHSATSSSKEKVETVTVVRNRRS